MMDKTFNLCVALAIEDIYPCYQSCEILIIKFTKQNNQFVKYKLHCYKFLHENIIFDFRKNPRQIQC